MLKTKLGLFGKYPISRGTVMREYLHSKFYNEIQEENKD